MHLHSKTKVSFYLISVFFQYYCYFSYYYYISFLYSVSLSIFFSSANFVYYFFLLFIFLKSTSSIITPFLWNSDSCIII
ncbi:hypothetical protein STCU_10809 [Strigomonas culicis]|uniref:Uncharacterized protein n=1 Tax=Strigomonas culicis TaxID=28005 RepID=S9TGI0_9TRYP|nr:hypothetical protein STCU_10809 [Strigomonas culicis]|eukprot:EPY17117.1 hypothetical protein STCU_10809 [Strigomonas culicis]